MSPKRSKAKTEVKDYLHKQFPLISVLKDLKPQQVKALIPYIAESSHDALCLCVHNALKNYKRIGEKEQLALEPLNVDMDKYRYLSDKRFTQSDKVLAKRSEILEQTGEGLPLILGAVLPLLTSLLGK